VRIIDCQQGSREWIEARLGIPTASCFGRLLTPGRLELSAQRRKYMAELLVEWATGEPVEDFGGGEWVERGRLMEPRAREYYSALTGDDVTTVGMCMRDGVGASPDGLTDAATVEIKCPSPTTHLLWLAGDELPREHRAQVQGQIWVTGRPWGDFLSYHPDFPPLLIRSEPDGRFQAALDDALPVFLGEIAAAKERLFDLGVHPPGRDDL